MTDLIKFEELDQELFFQCRKKALTKARVLTSYDLKVTSGIIETLEGPAKFVPGDFLCIGVKNELWPITKARFENTKERVSEFDDGGWAKYKNTNTVRAIQMHSNFEVQLGSGSIVEGNAEGFLIDGGTSQWPCDEEIFNETYERI